MHDVCTEQYVGNAKCASPSLSRFLSSFFLARRLFPLSPSLSPVRHVGNPRRFFVTGVQGETSTIKPTTLNE